MTPDCKESERLGSTVRGDILYIRGSDTYSIGCDWDNNNHKLRTLCWTWVWDWNGRGQQLGEDEKRLVIERTAALLREQAAEVIIKEPQDIEVAIPDSSHVFADASYSSRKPWWKFW
jgi:hypothetical protein